MLKKIVLILSFSILLSQAKAETFGILNVEDGLTVHKEQTFNPNQEDQSSFIVKFDIILPKLTGSKIAEKYTNYLNEKVKHIYHEATLLQHAMPDYSMKYNVYSSTTLPFLSISLHSQIQNKDDMYGYYWVENTIFNYQNGSIVNLTDIFTNDGIDYLIADINRQIKENSESKFFQNAIVTNLNNAECYFDGDQVVFTFQIYDISPYSSGQPSFSYSLASLQQQKFLKYSS
ncbi:MAG: RsiV family protein [Alphaproteobacteria bacterium]|jgi:hypothetical protein|nr:RsiV family protein [Alphaproteobacteria bacterium]